MDPDSEEEEDDDGEDDDEDPPKRKWHGIEAIFEAYQEHVEGTQGEREAGPGEGPGKGREGKRNRPVSTRFCRRAGD